MSAPPLDRRLHAYRPDLADQRLAGRVGAERFVAGTPARIAVAAAALRKAPAHDAALLTEALFGEPVRVFEEAAGWAWLQLEGDGYVGYAEAATLAPAGAPPTHRVCAVRTFVYPGPDLKLPPRGWLPLGAEAALGEEVVTRGTPYRLLPGEGGGALAAAHLVPLAAPFAADFVAVAERFIGTPYLWGGKTGIGLDCSGLVQVALAAAGRAVPRDTDLQEAGLPRLAGDLSGPLARGDLVFWPGHVGILTAPDRLLHANAFHMEVSEEPLAEAVARIARNGTRVSSVRRPATG